MKFRNGYVSNSSSSSFLVFYKNIEDFEKFQFFNEHDSYNEFMNDLKSSNESQTLELITSLIEEYIYCFKENFICQMEGKESFYSYDELAYKPWTNIPYDLKYTDTSVRNKLEKLRKTTALSKKDVNDCYYKMKFDKDAEKFMDFLKKEGFTVKAIEYSDDTTFGNYMEHSFMPFVMHYPGKEIIVYCQSNH